MITTNYSTGQPVINPGILISSILLLVVGAITDDNIGWAGSAGFLIAFNAISNYVFHRIDRRPHQEDIP